jgi:hypothetical protein
MALALSRDQLHSRAREQWDTLRAAGAKLHTSVPVIGGRPFSSSHFRQRRSADTPRSTHNQEKS